MDENKPRRPWLSFGIRDLLWAMAFLGACIGWWQDRRENDRIALRAESLEVDLRLMTSQFGSDAEAKVALLAELTKCRGEEITLSRANDGKLRVQSMNHTK